MHIPYTPLTRESGLDPITHVTPFTMRAGSTYLSILEGLSNYLDTLTEYVSGLDVKIVDKVNAEIDALKLEVETAIADGQTLTDEKLKALEQSVNAAVEQIINSSIEVSDSVVSKLVEGGDTDTRRKLDSIYQPLGDYQASGTVSDLAVKELVNDTESESSKALTTKYVENSKLSQKVVDDTVKGRELRTALDRLYGPFVNVLEFGAGEGGDVTAKVQAAVNALPATGGCVVFPPGNYTIRGMVVVKSNTVLRGVGATLQKDKHVDGVEPLFAALGGRGEVNNITIDGFHFKGAYPERGVCALWGHRANDVKFTNNVVTEAVANGHVIDLQGCVGVTIEGNTFAGSIANEARGFTEAIQLDHSVRGGAPGDASSETFDGTATSNVIVSGNRFVGWNGNRAPRPMGSHSAVEARLITNILFADNYVEAPNVRLTGSLRAAMNFIGVDDIRIHSNRFQFKGDRNAPQVVKFHDAFEWTRLLDVDKRLPATTATDKMRGTILDVGGNTTDTYTLPLVEGNIHQIEYTNSNFINFGEAGLVVEISGGRVELTGAMKCVTTEVGYLATSAKRQIGRLPEGVWPRRELTFVCQGSSSDRWCLEVGKDGWLTASRYTNASAVNAWLPVAVGWNIG